MTSYNLMTSFDLMTPLRAKSLANKSRRKCEKIAVFLKKCQELSKVIHQVGRSVMLRENENFSTILSLHSTVGLESRKGSSSSLQIMENLIPMPLNRNTAWVEEVTKPLVIRVTSW